MIKIIGAALLVCGGTMLGAGRCNDLKRRLKLIEGLDRSLALMKSEICEMLSPLPDVFGELAQSGPPAVRGFFSEMIVGERDGLADAWAQAVSRLDLSKSDRERLAALARILGRFDADVQREEIQRLRESLGISAGELRREINSKGRSYAGLGACFGAMLALILL